MSPNPFLNRAVFLCSLVGLLVAGYLWQMHSHPSDIPCGGSGGCETVANSIYSRFPSAVGPPVAALGTLGYIGLIALSFARTLPALAKQNRALLLLVIAGAAGGSLFSLYLTWLEVYKIGAICKWCLASQTIIILVCGLAITEWVQMAQQNRRTKANSV